MEGQRPEAGVRGGLPSDRLPPSSGQISSLWRSKAGNTNRPFERAEVEDTRVRCGAGPSPRFLGHPSRHRPVLVASELDRVLHALENLDIGSRSAGHHQAPLVQPRRFALWLVVCPEQEASAPTHLGHLFPSREEIMRSLCPGRVLKPHLSASLPQSVSQSVGQSVSQPANMGDVLREC